jgi:hypothetical protein
MHCSLILALTLAIPSDGGGATPGAFAFQYVKTSIGHLWHPDRHPFHLQAAEGVAVLGDEIPEAYYPKNDQQDQDELPLGLPLDGCTGSWRPGPRGTASARRGPWR